MAPQFQSGLPSTLFSGKTQRGIITQLGKNVREVDKRFLKDIARRESAALRGSPIGPVINNKQISNRGIIVKGGRTGQAERIKEYIGGWDLPNLTKDQRKVLSGTIGGHELDELATKGFDPNIARNYGHKNIDVLLREHNRMATLPKEYTPVRETMSRLRAHPHPLGKPTEAEMLKGYGVHYGEPGTRLSRHARKRIKELAIRDGAPKNREFIKNLSGIPELRPAPSGWKSLADKAKATRSKFPWSQEAAVV